MAHDVLFSHNVNGFVRQLRAFMMDAPGVNRTDHEDIANLGVDYTLGIGGSRPAGDILQIAPEGSALRSTYRVTIVTASASSGSLQSVIQNTVTFNTGARTIVDDGGGDWATAGVVVGDLIRIENAATGGNEGVWKVLSITTGGSTNDTITLDTLDSLAASDSADPIDVYPITGGSVFDVREDQPSGNNHIGWMMDEIEFFAKDATLWLFMRSGGSWAINDFAEFTLERGRFSLHDSVFVQRVVDLNENGAGADTITRSDYIGNFLRDGFVSGGMVEVEGSAGEDGRYKITTAAATVLTIAIGDFTADELAVDVKLTPRFEVASDPVLVISTDDTITRDDGGSWLTDGFLDGGLIEIQDTISNNGLFLIKGVPTATVLTIDGAEGLVAETLPAEITVTPRNSILQAWTEHRYLADDNDVVGLLPPRPDGNGNYTSEWIGIGPGIDPVNNPETIYCGWQTQFSGANDQNVESRVFDAVSGGAFNSLGNASPPVYFYLTLTPSMETFLSGDGEMVAGFLDVNTSVTEWFYAGFGGVHGTQNQHPRPMMLGGMNWEPTGDRTGTGDRYRFFPQAADFTGTTDVNDVKINAGSWHRWVDGTYYANAQYHQSNGGGLFGANEQNTEMFSLPYYKSDTQFSIPILDGGLADYSNAGGGVQDNIVQNFTFINALRATPTTITPNPNREYPLLPITLCMMQPSFNVVADWKRVFHVPGAGQATKNLIIQGGKTYAVGQNHEKTGQQDFAALLLD